jgi:hypothetical protein
MRGKARESDLALVQLATQGRSAILCCVKIDVIRADRPIPQWGKACNCRVNLAARQGMFARRLDSSVNPSIRMLFFLKAGRRLVLGTRKGGRGVVCGLSEGGGAIAPRETQIKSSAIKTPGGCCLHTEDEGDGRWRGTAAPWGEEGSCVI